MMTSHLSAWVIGLAVLVAVATAGSVLGWLAWSALPRWRARHAGHMRRELSEFFLFIDPAQLWVATVLAGAVVAAMAYAMSGSLAVVVAAVLACLVLPQRVLVWLRRRRLQRFDAQLPDALLTLAAALRAGASLPVALRYLAEESEPPQSQEFALLLREQRLGATFDDAVASLAQRMPTEATQLTVSALRIAADTGGNLAEALERVAGTVRARLQMAGRVDALTAQGRLQAWVVGALPLLLTVALTSLEPEVMSLLWRTQAGWLVIAAIAVLETLGIWWIRRIVAIDI